MTHVLLIRHGLTDDVGLVLSGTASGVHLNAIGREQASRAAAALRSVNVAAVLSSPLERTLETAQAIAAPHQLTVEVDDRLREFEGGQWTGRTIASLDGDPLWRRFNEWRSTTRAPGGELMLEVQQRIVATLMTLPQRFPDAIVAVVSHGDVIRAALMFALGMPLDFLHRLEISPARISVLQIEGSWLRVLQVNGDSVPALP